MARQPTTRLDSWREELAKEAVAQSAQLPVSAGDTLSIKGGKLSYKGEQLKNNELQCIVLDWTHHNRFFKGDYDDKNPQPPVCYAYGVEEKQMKPHPSSSEPQHTDCATCPHNQWASGKGKGKACRNGVKIGVVPEKGLDGDIATLVIPPTSIKNFSGYSQKVINALKLPTFAVITKLSSDMAPYATAYFELVRPIEDGAIIGEIMEKRKTIDLATAYSLPTEAAPTTTRARFSGARKL